MFNQFPSLAEAFLNYFDIELVATQSERDRIGRLRYRVYCEEFGYEPAEKFPDGRETDRFDDHSLHCIITHRRSGETAGCVRLICATDKHILPLEAYCLPHVYVDYLDPLAQQRNRVCEVSRLAVDPAFRRRPGRKTHPAGGFRRPRLLRAGATHLLTDQYRRRAGRLRHEQPYRPHPHFHHDGGEPAPPAATRRDHDAACRRQYGIPRPAGPVFHHHRLCIEHYAQ